MKPTWHAPTATTVGVVALTGFINLSYEMLWVRAYSFSIKGAAHAFPFLLGAYLVGLALGSLASTRISRRLTSEDPRALTYVAGFVGLGNLAGYLMIPFMGWLSTLTEGPEMMTMLIPVLLASTALGVQFPLLSHYGVQANSRAGMGVATLYVANIVGSVLGSLLTGFWLMEIWPTATTALFLLAAGMVTTWLILLHSTTRKQLAATTLFLGTLTLALATLHGALFDRLWDKLLFHNSWATQSPVAQTLENRVGVINVTQDQRVFSGGVYDGNFSVDLFHDKNGIVRPFSLSAFHPKPARILYCGLGSGSWASVIASHPDAQEIVIAEINPAYLALVKNSPHAWILDDPRVTFVTDDVRRYLRRNHKKFDAFVFNMTFHWRSLASTVLSVEFFELVKNNLNADGVFMINATGSPRVFKSATLVFPDVYRFLNTVVASPDAIDVSGARLKETLLRYQVEGTPVVPPSQTTRLQTLISVFENPTTSPKFDDFILENKPSLEAKLRDVLPITDDNTGEEYTGF